MHFKSSCFERRTRGRAVRSTLILLFAKKFFRGPSRTGGFRNRFTANTDPKKLKPGFSVTLANEADRFEYSGSWLAARRFFGLTFFPPSPLFGTRAFCLCAGRTDYKSVFHSQTIGLWEIVSSYSSATAPASHRISRADPLFQTRKELSEQ